MGRLVGAPCLIAADDLLGCSKNTGMICEGMTAKGAAAVTVALQARMQTILGHLRSIVMSADTHLRVKHRLAFPLEFFKGHLDEAEF